VFYEKKLFEEIKVLACQIIKQTKDPKYLIDNLTSKLSKYISSKVDRSPEIIPVIV